MSSPQNLPYRVPEVKKTTSRRRAPAKVIEVVEPKAKMHPMILAFDQTIGNCGYAYMELADGIPYVIKTGCVKSEPIVEDDMEDMLLRACALRLAIKVSLKDYNPVKILHERPIPYGRRTDSSIMAATVVRLIAQEYNLQVAMYSDTHVKKLIAGKANASKAEIKTAVRSQAPSVTSCKPFNEHVADAVAIGLTYFKELP